MSGGFAVRAPFWLLILAVIGFFAWRRFRS